MINGKTLEDVDVTSKRVLVRVDFNVPLDGDKVIDNSRILAALPTLKYLQENNAKIIILTHIGRPEAGKDNSKFSTKHLLNELNKHLHNRVTYVDDISGSKAQKAASELLNGDVLLLENIRFDERESKGDDELSKELAGLADIYVNDAFGASHRNHSSISGVPKYIPSVFGKLLELEVNKLSSLLASPRRPFVAVLGGSKVSDKIGVIENLLNKVDALIIGGGMCFTFLKALEYEIGNSLVEDEWVDKCKVIMDEARQQRVELLLPTDIVIANKIDKNAETQIVAANCMPQNMMGLDIGPKSVEAFSRVIALASTIFWNGPMGVFEIDAFENGTKGVAEAIVNSEATSIVGGGDSVAALKKFNFSNKPSYISTGGGASMKLLEEAPLPGIDALVKNNC